MSKGFKEPITINEAMENIDKNLYLLPAIQRKFVWHTNQIELLFDSIMREYPINSLMLWEITSDEMKNEQKFYSFLRKFRERYGESNEKFNARGRSENFYAVIDGQQRLNSLYIGLKGTYALKLKSKWWIDKEENFPPMKLYLDISKEYFQETDIDKKYNFQFLKDEKWEKDSLTKDIHWFEVGDILTLKTKENREKYLKENDLNNNEYAINTLKLLSKVINDEKILTYYVENEQDPDKVLDIFIRTNDGGTKLSFSDLLMSFLTAYWPEAREHFDELIKDVNKYGNFNISTDLILKVTLVLFSKDVKNRVKNFDKSIVNKVEASWEEIRKAILNSFVLFYKLGFEERTFPAKNAAIPIIYYVYKKQLQEELVKSRFIESKSEESDAKVIKKWLLLVFLKRIFGGQSDAVLIEIRKIIDGINTSEGFPLKQIMSNAKGNPNKNYTFDDEFINELFETEAGSSDAFFVLSLFYPELNYFDQHFDIDHVHPQSKFTNKKFMSKNFTEEQTYNFLNKYNKLSNLQLLNNEKNNSKRDKFLIDWVTENNIEKSYLFVNDEISLELCDFLEFYENRKKNMKIRLKELVN